jgi:aspartyl-tRNA(Asn)/glutamyl-tRNA(Gln) amidotransferase subunit A
MDTIGQMARTAADCRMLFDVLTGTSPRIGGSAEPSAEAIRVGVDRATIESSEVGADVVDTFERALEALGGFGARIVDVSLPYFDASATVYRVGAFAEALSFHRKTLSVRYEDYSIVARLMLVSAAMSSATDYVQVQRVRRVTRERLLGLFEDVDLVAAPIRPAYWLVDVDYEQAYEILNSYWDSSANHATYWSNVGFPAIAVPMGQADSGLPVGLQLAGRPGEDGVVLRVAEIFQAGTDHHTAEPHLLSEVGE